MVVVDAGVELECVQVHSLAELFRLRDSLASRLLPLAVQFDGLCAQEGRSVVVTVTHVQATHTLNLTKAKPHLMPLVLLVQLPTFPVSLSFRLSLDLTGGGHLLKQKKIDVSTEEVLTQLITMTYLVLTGVGEVEEEV